MGSSRIRVCLLADQIATGPACWAEPNRLRGLQDKMLRELLPFGTGQTERSQAV